MLRDRLAALVRAAAARLAASDPSFAQLTEVAPEIQDTKDPAHGDYATNLAMVSAKTVGVNPRALGEKLAPLVVEVGAPLVTACEVAGPGFLNLRLEPGQTVAAAEVALKDGYGTLMAEHPMRVNVEFVSVNPNGPITIGSGRGAAYGSALCNVLEAAGHVVHREYYINDGVNSEQMRLFAESVRAYVEGHDLPENGYKGEYVQDVARALGGPLEDYQSAAQAMMIERQRTDLATFGVVFDTWFSEQSLHDSGKVARAISRLEASGVADDEPYRTKLKLGRGGKVEEVEQEDQPVDEDDAEGAGKTLWLRSTRFGDDMDRVLRRRDGRLTYIASDVAYHENKFSRPENATKLITILGPDHHGYIGRLTAVVAALLADEGMTDETALNEAKDKLQVVIYQLVRFLKDGQPAPMRKRDGNIYELRDLINEIGEALRPDGTPEEKTQVGVDVGRYFFLMRSHDSALDFDLDTAVKGSEDNPVFYVQYAHARIRSLFRKGDEMGLAPDRALLETLTDPREAALARKILDLPWEIKRAAEDGGVHRIATYATELARAYTHFYEGCRVLDPDHRERSQARLALCDAAAKTLKTALSLLGVSAPERM